MAKHDEWKLLVVEDDREDYELLRGTFDEIEQPCHLDWARTYEAGLEQLTTREYDACLLDYWLGEKDGLELARAARAQGCEVPIILLTGVAGNLLDRVALAAGADDYLEKDRADAVLLERTIRYAIERKRTLSELAKTAKENASLKAFAEMVTSSHLTEPLRIMVDTLEKLQDRSGTPDTDTEASMTRALAAARRMRKFIDDLAEFSRSASEKKVSG